MLDFKLSQFDNSRISTDPTIIHNKIYDIINIVFLNDSGEKRKIRFFDNRLNFACPYCKDSDTNTNKHRGNLYYENYFYKCFNCGITKPFTSFLEDFSDIIHIDKMDLLNIKILEKNKNNLSRNNNFYFDKKEYRDFFKFDIDSFIKKIDVDYININSKEYKYLHKDRLIPEVYFDRIVVKKNGNLLFLNLVEYEGVEYVISYSERTHSKVNKYLIHSYSSVTKSMGDETQDTSEFKNFNSLSNIYNVFNVDYQKKTIVFEGPIDSMFMDNSIAIQGADKNIPIHSEGFMYFLDNDITGKRVSTKLLQDGKKIFLWKKFLEDYKISQYGIKDLNDVFIIIKKLRMNLYTDDLYKFFSNNKLDLWNL